MMERRLDVIVFRLHWALSIYSAKQLINHKNITINGRIITKPSYLVKENDTIGVSYDKYSRALIKENLLMKTNKLNKILSKVYL